MTQTTISTITKLISQVLDIYEVDVESTFLEAGFVKRESSNSNRISMEDMSNLWSIAVRKTNNPQLGLVAASIFQPAYLKGIGLAWMASSNLEEGLVRFVNNSQLINTAMQIELEVLENDLFIKYQSKEQNQTSIKAHPCAIQLGVGFFLKMFRLASSKNIPATAVYFTFPIDDSKAAYEEYFQCPVYGSCEVNGIKFSRQLLQEQLPTHDPELVTLTEISIDKHVKEMSAGQIASQVIKKVSEILSTGYPTEERIAHELCMSKRTLQRKLHKEGHSYSALVNNVRIELAKQHLSSSSLPVSQVALELGYNSSSAFARAFKKHLNQSPQEYRAAATH